jgi:hypothetical protein
VFPWGLLQAGTYTLGQTPPAGVSFSHWECYNVTNGTAGNPVNGSTVTLALANSFSCVAVYIVTIVPPNPKLALLSQYPAAYPLNSPTANLTATGPGGANASCVEAPSQRLIGVINATAPGDGLCFGNGTVPPGTYNLTQVPAPGTLFSRWECYNTTGGAAGTPVNVTSVTLVLNVSMTCVAVYTLVPTQPRLALLSEFPSYYTGPTGNLTAVSIGETCQKFPSPRINAAANVTVINPVGGGCGSNATFGTSPAGSYTLGQVCCMISELLPKKSRLLCPVCHSAGLHQRLAMGKNMTCAALGAVANIRLLRQAASLRSCCCCCCRLHHLEYCLSVGSAFTLLLSTARPTAPQTALQTALPTALLLPTALWAHCQSLLQAAVQCLRWAPMTL